MAVQAKGRVTFQKIVDGSTLSFALSANMGTTQIKSKDPVSFFPNYPTNNLIITPVLTVSGEGGTNQVKGTCNWFVDNVRITSGQGGYTIQTSGTFSLVIAANLTKASTIIRCEYEYTQPATGLRHTVTTTIPLQQVENAGTMIMAQIHSQHQQFIKDGPAEKTLSFEAKMIRGGDEDTTNVGYKWEITGTNGNYYTITAATAPAGSGLPAGNLFTGWNTKTLTVSSAAITNIATIRLTCTDTDSASSTFNKTCLAEMTVRDATDPYDLVISTPMGNSMSQSNAAGCPMQIDIYQNNAAWKDEFYLNKKLVFYRLTAAGAKDTTWAPATSDFPGWAIASGEVSRTYNSTAGLGTPANRTVSIKWAHLLAGVSTTFEAAIDF